MTKKILLIISAFFINACAVLTPVHESEPPEVLGNWGFKFGYLVGTSNVVGTQRTVTTDQDYSFSDTVVGARFAFGFLDNFQLTTDAYTGIGSGGGSASLKWQFMGNNYFNAKEGDVAMSVILRSWSGAALGYDSAISGDTYAESDIEGHGLDLTYLVGYRILDWLSAYTGPKYIKGTITEKYKNVKDGPVVFEDDRDFDVYGALAGLSMSPHSKHFAIEFNMELQYMNFPATYSGARNWQMNRMVSLAIPFNFN